MSRFMREDAQFIIKKAIQAVLPDEAVRRALQEHAFSGKIVLVAAGKAAWQMAQAAHQCLGNLIDTGAVVTKYGHVKGPIANFACYEGGHPVPDENSFQGTQAALDLVSGLTEQDTVLFLLSGGGSALFEKPLVSGEELQDVTNQLLASGADIVEMNTIRKRLSAVKGGRFAQLCAPARVFSVVLSDILGDPLDMIASGPACPDPSTCAQARAIAEKYGLKLSEGVRRLLDQETPKELDNVESLVVGSVRELCTAAANACLELDYTPIMLTDQLCCQAREAGSFLASIARSHAEDGKSLAFLAGGETVVRLTGHGKGGRNQELALAAADGISGLDNVLIFSMGSDGTDGPTDAAGGIVDGRTAQILADQGILIHRVLEDNDAYHALQKTDGLVITGPTGTNVNDVAVVLVRGRQSNKIDNFKEETAMLKIDLSKLSGFIPEDYVSAHLERLEKAAAMIADHEGPGGDFTGWVHLPREYDKEEFARIQAAAEKIKKQSQVLVVIGIGGSYLGARAVIDLLKSPFYNQKPKDTPDIYFTGNGLSTDTLLELIEMIGDRDFSVNVISKSGTTTESAIGFRVFKGILEERYGKEGARERIYATTDKARGALKGLADAEGYEEFVVPDAIGGRYSVLTAVGLLPIACAGVDIQALMDGAGQAMNDLSAGGPENPAWKYAAARHALFESGKKVEFLAGYEPPFRFFAEWWKQLYGESEGKEHKGLLPASLEYTADLHSMGQYIQEGQRTMSEVVVKFAPKGEFLIPHDPENIDGLNFLAGKPLSYVADRAMRGVILAHVDGGVPNVLIEMPPISETTVGYLIYFFEYVCGLSGHLLEINPFNQPGVEAYKSNMFALLGKPGYEEKQAELEKRL